MTIIQLIILQLVAHLITDFVLQPQSWCDIKCKKVFTKVLIYHIIIVFVASYVLSFDFGFWKAAILIAAVHFLIDILKIWLSLKTKSKYLFFIDQFLHLIFVTGIVLVYGYYYGVNFIIQMETKTLAIIAGFLLCAKPANIIIRFIFEAFTIETPNDDPKQQDDKSLPNAGKLIGIAERFLALALILLGQYEAVGLIIAAKSILRFNATSKSEYVLIGTLLSFGIAVFSGIIIGLIK